MAGLLRTRVAAAGAHWLDLSADAAHNRTVVTLAGAPAAVLEALFGCVSAAVERLDLRRHSGVHPRVGVADVVPLVPLAGCDLDDCAASARSLGERVWTELRVPVYFYGAGVSLADIRAGRARPDLGGPQPHPTAGAVCIGARPLLVAFNVLLPGAGRRRALELAGALRTAAGGPPGVQALAFELPGGVQQLSFNLVRPLETTIPRLLEAIRALEPAAGPEEVVGLCPAAAAGPGAEGKLLEARLAAAAAGAAAELAGGDGGEELGRLAVRLEKEAAALAGLGYSGAELLGGAERAYALLRVLRAGGLLRDDLGAMLELAARRLRAAVPTEARERFPERLALLDRWLSAPGVEGDR